MTVAVIPAPKGFVVAPWLLDPDRTLETLFVPEEGQIHYALAMSIDGGEPTINSYDEVFEAPGAAFTVASALNNGMDSNRNAWSVVVVNAP